MRYLLLSLMLIGCGKGLESADHYNVKLDDLVTIKSGFYKGCSGMITNYSHYDTLSDSITIENAVCGNIKIKFIIMDAKDLK